MRAAVLFAVWKVLPEALVERWSSRAMTQWKKMDGGVTNLVVAVCLPQVRDFHQLITESGGEADEHSFVLGFQVYQELLATWEKMPWTPGEI